MNEAVQVEFGSTNKDMPAGNRFLSESWSVYYPLGDGTDASASFIGVYGMNNQDRPTSGSPLKVADDQNNPSASGAVFYPGLVDNASSLFSIGTEVVIKRQAAGGETVASDDVQVTSSNLAPVPEPSSLALACVALGGLVFEIRRRRRKARLSRAGKRDIVHFRNARCPFSRTHSWRIAC
jgi:hypothetical protein